MVTVVELLAVTVVVLVSGGTDIAWVSVALAPASVVQSQRPSPPVTKTEPALTVLPSTHGLGGVALVVVPKLPLVPETRLEVVVAGVTTGAGGVAVEVNDRRNGGD